MKIYKVDQSWFDVETKKVVGDMASTFQDSDESRTDNLNELLSNIKSVINDLYEEDLATTDNIRILEVQMGEVEDEYDFPKDGWETLLAIVVCPQDVAKNEYGLVREVEKIYQNVGYMIM